MLNGRRLGRLLFFGIALFYLNLSQLIASEKVQVKGSSTIFPIAKEAATEFGKSTKKVVMVDGGGSCVGIKFATEGGLGMVSRSLKPDEAANGLKAHKIGTDGLAVIVSKDHPLNELTKEKLVKIMTGEIKNWQELGGLDAAIAVTSCGEEHGTHEAFLDNLGIRGKLVKDFKPYKSHKETIFKIAKDKNAIGWAPVGDVESQPEAKVKALKVDGTEATTASVKAGTYKLSRELNFVTKGDPAGDVKEFLQFMTSDKGQEIVAKHGFVRAIN